MEKNIEHDVRTFFLQKFAGIVMYGPVSLEQGFADYSGFYMSGFQCRLRPPDTTGSPRHFPSKKF